MQVLDAGCWMALGRLVGAALQLLHTPALSPSSGEGWQSWGQSLPHANSPSSKRPGTGAHRRAPRPQPVFLQAVPLRGLNKAGLNNLS